MLDKLGKVGVLSVAFFLCAVTLAAQDSSNRPQKPLPPAASEDHRSEAQKAFEATLPSQEPQIEPDTRPLSGAQNLTLGINSLKHSFLLPSFSVVTQAGTNRYGATDAAGVQSTTFLAGRLALDRTSGRSQLTLNYMGGGTLSNTSSQGNSAIQGLTAADTIRLGRWSLVLGDDFNYLSESPFGFGGLGGLDALGIGVGTGAGRDFTNPSFRPDLLPNQTILVRAPRISNTALFQADYQLNRRSSLTLLGSYGILNFINTAGFFDSRNTLFQSGYNHTMSRNDSIAVFYRFNTFRFSNIAQAIDGHSVQVTYARRIAGRLSFQIGGGPEINTFRAPVRGSGTLLNWTLSSALNYQFAKTGVGLNFNRSLSGGSGVFPGAEANQFQGFVSRSLSRNWAGTVSLGFSKNQVLRQTNLFANSTSPDALFVTGHIGRSYGRSGYLFFDYSLMKQSNVAVNSAFATHGVHSLVHIVSVGYSWGLRPIAIE